MNTRLHYTTLWRALGLTWLFVISVLSVSAVDQPLDFDNADKWLHWVTWMLMMVWFGSAWVSAPKRCFIFLLVMGAALELLQGLLPWRFMDLYDLLANLAGLITGLLLLGTPAGKLLPYFDRVLVHRFNAPPA